MCEYQNDTMHTVAMLVHSITGLMFTIVRKYGTTEQKADPPEKRGGKIYFNVFFVE